jgi:LysR family glycine cleavage system transcriptional activator
MSRGLPPLNSLAMFVAAARHLNFTRAAEELFVTQAAVSHQIKTLEESLGVALFHRLGRGQGLVLTDAGRAYLPLVTAALDTIRSATKAVMDSRRKRVINIAALDSFGSLWLLPRLGRFLRAHPDIDVRLTSVELEADPIASGAIDVDIRYGDGHWQDCVVVKLLTETLFPVCSPALLAGERPLVRPADLRHHTLLHDDITPGWAEWLQLAGCSGLDTQRGPRFNRANLVIQAAISGDGVALGRSALVQDPMRNGLLVRPFDLAMPAPFAYYLVTSRARDADRTVVEFRDWLLAEAAASQRNLDELAPAGVASAAGGARASQG